MPVVCPGTSEKEVTGKIRTLGLGMFKTSSVRAPASALLRAGICGG